ncbi:MAG: alpha/beta hydrolase, partial [Betaproteobacteria bacterium]|nr:alpha/beta hydrolase [Betaproteobacteria bacterium]
WLTAADGKGYAAAYCAFAKESSPADGLLAELRAPFLFLTGENDPHSTPEMSAALAKIAPHGEAVVVRGAAHLLQLTHAAEVNRALSAFAAKCGGG